jgi:membrane protease YdiL (CAAX protease family)
VGTLEQAPPAAPRPPGFWWRVLSPVGAILAAFIAAAAVFVPLDASSLSEDAVTTLLSFAGSLLILAFAVLLWRALPAHERRLAVARPSRPLPTIAVGAIVGVGLLVGVAAIVAAGSAIDPGVRHELDQVDEIGTAPWQLALTGIAVIVLAPLGEELVYRALLLRALARRMRFGFAAILSGVVFGASHLDAYTLWPRLIGLVLVGVGLAWLYRRRGYWASVTAHAVVNVVAFTSLVATSL